MLVLCTHTGAPSKLALKAGAPHQEPGRKASRLRTRGTHQLPSSLLHLVHALADTVALLELILEVAHVLLEVLHDHPLQALNVFVQSCA